VYVIAYSTQYPAFKPTETWAKTEKTIIETRAVEKIRARFFFISNQSYVNIFGF